MSRLSDWHIAALLAALGRGAPHDVVDFLGLQAVALGQGLQDRGGQVLRVEVGQRSLADLADAARRGVDDAEEGNGVVRVGEHAQVC